MEMVVDEFVIALSIKDNITNAVKKLERDTEALLVKLEERFAKLSKSIPAGVGGGSKPAPRPATKKNFDDRAYAAANSATINKMLNGGAQSALAAMEAKSKIWAAAGRANIDQAASGFKRTLIDTQNVLRSFNTRAANQSGATRIAPEIAPQPRFRFLGRSAAEANNTGENSPVFSRTITNAQNGIRAFNGRVNQAGNALGRASQGANNLAHSSQAAHSGLQGMIAGFFALHTVMHLLTESIQVGMERQRAMNGFELAYNKQGEAAAQAEEVRKLSDKYGTNLSEALQQSAQIKNLLGDVMSNKELAQYHESVTVEAGMGGNTQEQINRFTMALEKMSGAKNGGGVQFIQIQKAMPAILARMAREQGVNQTTLRGKAKGMTGEQFAKMITDFMARDITTKNANGVTARDQYAKSDFVMMNRVRNDTLDSMVTFQKAASTGVSAFAESLSNLMRSNQWLFNWLGDAFNGLLTRLTPLITAFSDFLIYLDIIGIGIQQWYHQLSPEMQGLVDVFTGITKDLLAAAFVVTLGSVIGSVIASLWRLNAAILGAVGGGSAAAGAGMVGLMGAVGSLALAIAGAYMVVKPVADKWFDAGDKYGREHYGSDTLAGGNIRAGSPVGHAWKDVIEWWKNLTSSADGISPDDFSKGNLAAITRNNASLVPQDMSKIAENMTPPQKVDFNLTTPQETKVNVILDLQNMKQQIDAMIQYHVDDSTQLQNFDGKALSYHPQLR
ncbi:hypothetical protein [Buttiauxella noackiae]|uniref:hypothetical protein n=1 Tax=Buttiauxella noackiae TaxID=82992 RepID=UPI00054EC326|nr:hypothetical protein [Buttiauxella noackiae]